MKRILKTCTMVTVMLLSGAIRNESAGQVSAGISFQVFYDELSPYGRWIDYPQYGYVWSPSDFYSNDFQPYRTGGHWVWTGEYGWLWVSDYDWGWATFHYGRWFYDPFYGWLWEPGYDWAPAWVVWRSGGGYYGWAPMSPGISFSISFGNYSPPSNYWCFVPRQYIVSNNISYYSVNVQRNTTILNNTTFIKNYDRRNNVFVTGPQRVEAEQYTHTRIRPVEFRESGRPGRSSFRNNEVTMYRPEIRKGNAGNIAPRKFENYHNNRQDNGMMSRPDNRRQKNDNSSHDRGRSGEMNPVPYNPRIEDRRSGNGNHERTIPNTDNNRVPVERTTGRPERQYSPERHPQKQEQPVNRNHDRSSQPAVQYPSNQRRDIPEMQNKQRGHESNGKGHNEKRNGKGNG